MWKPRQLSILCPLSQQSRSYEEDQVHMSNSICSLNLRILYIDLRPGPGWAHISCSLWIPEVKFGNVDRMEPITNIEGVSVSSTHWIFINYHGS